MAKLSETMQQRIIAAALRTWNAIGADCLVNEDGQPDQSVTLSKEEVIELVVDAGRMLTYGGDMEAAEVFYIQLTSHERDQIMTAAFPHEHYGW